MGTIGLPEFLSWVIYGGGAVMCASWILERIAWFQAQTAEAKKMITYGASALFAVGSYALITYAPKFVEAAQPYFMILAGIFAMIFLNNVFHALDRTPKG